MMMRLSLLCVAVLSYAYPVLAADYAAISLKRAGEAQVAKDRALAGTAMILAGITRPLALIHDIAHDDLVLVGERDDTLPSVTLDDWSVAARSEFIVGRDPVVSIDQTPDTPDTGKQAVRFEGALKDTRFGADLLAADILLKRLGLGTTSAKIFGVDSFLALSAAIVEENPAEQSDFTRFWFLPMRSESYVYARDGVIIVEEYKIDVQSQRYIDGKDTNDMDPAVRGFAQSIRANFGDLKTRFPSLARMEQLYYLTALAQGLSVSGVDKADPSITHWLSGHKIQHVETRRDYPLEENATDVTLAGGKQAKILLSGGIDFGALIVNLEDGVPDAVRDYVLASRPASSSLNWNVPLVSLSWTYDMDSAEIEAAKRQLQSRPDVGMSIQRQVAQFQQGRPVPFQPAPVHIPSGGLKVATIRDLSSHLAHNSLRRVSPTVGGVMLSGSATVVGNDDAKVDLSSGNFSFVVDGKNARIDPKTFRKFMTALWAVYFSGTDPGISIDPICQPARAPECKGIDKHLVRYIGKVINTDLGRVMRETDYIMKQWSVGTERADFEDFKNPDKIAAEIGELTLASSRFWLVPKDLQFKEASGALLFKDGRMTVQTELLEEVKGKKVDDANQGFADWFTRRYADIAKKYPLYDDLFEYAKMVALAKYLKQQGVPLYWFLMANKDLVLTEDSPGTVAELAKGSDYFQGIEIRGGVELGATGKYVQDEEAMEAVRMLRQNARRWDSDSRQSAPRVEKSDASVKPEPRAGPGEARALSVGDKDYTVAPQHSLTSGKDRRGIRYQTDLALRQDGEPSMEVVRYFDPSRREGGEFGDGWRLLIPYRIEPAGRAKRRHGTRTVSERMFVVNQVTGAREILTFNADKYAVAGWIPAVLEGSQIVGLFLFTDDTFRLVDKLGNEFHFDASGYLTETRLSQDHHVFYSYVDSIRDAFEETPYLVRPQGEDRVEFRNRLIYQHMQVVDLINGTRETLIFGERDGRVGYLPEDSESRYNFLGLLTNDAFQLEDEHGNQIAFGPDGRFRGMELVDGERIVERMRQGEQEVEFQYRLSPQGLPIISGAHLVGSRDFVVWYWYNPEGQLDRVSRGPDRG